MFSLTVFDATIIAFGTMLTSGIAYLYIIAFAALKNKDVNTANVRERKVCAVIPAFNESSEIANCLEALLKAEGIANSDIYVIADNCTDNTAGIAKKHGVNVLERFDTTSRGKGYALSWAFSKIDINNYDYIFIVDADNIVASSVFRECNKAFELGADALQVCLILTSDKKASPLSVLQNIASIVENRLFWKGRNALGLYILLRGTGMAISTETLKKCPWNAFGITEDTEFALNLIKSGYSIRFLSDTSVETQSTSTYKQSASQKMRWASGTIHMIGRTFFPLIVKGISTGRLKLCELAFSLLLLSRPTLFYSAIMLGGTSFFCSPILRLPVFFGSIILILLVVIYLFTGIFFIPNKRTVFPALLHIPLYGFWLLRIQFLSLFFPKRHWVRTQRKNEKNQSGSK